jgi:hypothetical protein
LKPLDVVKPVRLLLAVTGYKRHRGTAVQQRNGDPNLRAFNPDFLRNLRNDFLHELTKISFAAP